MPGGRKIIDIYMMRIEGRPACEAEYLLASQRGTRIGALQFGRTSDGPSQVLEIGLPDTSSDLGSLEAFQEMVDRITNNEPIPDIIMNHVAPGSDLGGARPKGTIDIDGHPWLAKFGMKNDRINIAGAEAACLDLCEMVGLEACERKIIRIDGRDTLLLKRFDRKTNKNGNLDRIHMISGLTLLGAHSMDRESSGYADLYNAARKISRFPEIGENIYCRMVMNVLCGNTDDHYRNHAFLLEDHGTFKPSPVYDVTPSLQISITRKTFFHLGKAGSGRDATLENAVIAGPSLGLSRDRAIEIANDCSRIVGEHWKRAMSDRGVCDADIIQLERSFSESGACLKTEYLSESEDDPDLEF